MWPFVKMMQQEIEKLQLELNRSTETMMKEVEQAEEIPCHWLNEINRMQINLWVKRRNLMYIINSGPERP